MLTNQERPDDLHPEDKPTCTRCNGTGIARRPDGTCKACDCWTTHETFTQAIVRLGATFSKNGPFTTGLL